MLRDLQPAEKSQNHNTDHPTLIIEHPNSHGAQNSLIRDVSNVAYNLEHEQTNSGQHSGINNILDEVYGTALKGKSQEYQQTFANLLDMKLSADGTKGSVIDKFAEENFDFLSNGKNRITTGDLYGKATELGMMGRSLEKYLAEDVLIKSEEIRSTIKEHKFLGFGTKDRKDGFDRKQLAKDEDNELMNIAENKSSDPRMPWTFGQYDTPSIERVDNSILPPKSVDDGLLIPAVPKSNDDGLVIPNIPGATSRLWPRPYEPIPTHPVEPVRPAVDPFGAFQPLDLYVPQSAR